MWDRTGMLHSNTTAWRAQQRHRIAHLMNHPQGTRDVIVEEEGYLGSPVAEIRQYEAKELVDRYLNISFTGNKDSPPFVSPPFSLFIPQYLTPRHKLAVR